MLSQPDAIGLRLACLHVRLGFHRLFSSGSTYLPTVAPPPSERPPAFKFVLVFIVDLLSSFRIVAQEPRRRLTASDASREHSSLYWRYTTAVGPAFRFVLVFIVL